jgi:hypothetical protein
MGSYNHDRELRQLRARYIGAVGRLQKALEAWEQCGMPMDPGPGPQPYPWTRDQIAKIKAVSAAVNELIDARRTWDGLRREWRPVH